MATPSKFELLLSADAARRYMPVRFSVVRALVEATCTSDKLAKIMGEDMIHFSKLRTEIRDALASESDQQRSAATRWKCFLRPRIEMLDSWSGAFGTFTSFFAAVLGVGAIAMKPLGLDYWYLIAAGIGTILLSFLRFLLERQKAWYKYLVAHLEAIER